jgi:diguanylate cyclase (GGDEF)-like protein
MNAAMNLDMPTALLFTAMVSLTNAAAMSLLSLRDRSPYLRDWAISFFLVVAGLAVIGLRGIVPPLASVFFGNALAALGGAGIFVGLCRFMQRPVPWAFLGVIVGVSLAAIGWFSVGVDDPAAQLGRRVMVFSALIALLSAPCVWLIVSHARREGTVLSVMALVAELLLVGLSLLRVAVNAVAPVQGEFESVPVFNTQTREVLFVMAFGLTHLLQGYGLVSLHVSQLLRRVAAQANTDALTGLPNRRTFEDTWRRMVQRAGRDKSPLALMVMDIDHFKRVNDTHGHAAGDEALRVLGWALKNHLRPGDLCARWGGEEFILALPGATPEVARARAEGLLKMALTYGENGSGEPLAVTLSVGLTDWRSSDATPFATIARADAALYEAKRDGRHRVNVAA